VRPRYGLGLVVMLAACGGHAANVAETTPQPSTSVATDKSPGGAAAGPEGTATESSGSPSSTPSSVPAATEGTVSTTSVTRPPIRNTVRPGDTDAARTAVLSPDDLPGWRAEPAAPATDPSDATLISECRYLADFRGRASESAHASATFVHPDDLAELSNTVIVHTDVDAATTAFGVVDRRETARCLETILVGDGGPFTIDRASVTRVVIARADAGVRFDADLFVTVDGTRYEFAAQFTYVRVGRSISQGIAFGANDISTESDAALDAVTSRLDDLG
jgi:hypothetical protein